MKAVLRSIRISPKKANLVAGTVRGKKVTEALTMLKFMPKKGADILYKVVHSAASNAKNNFQQSFDDLMISRILVSKGPTLKRSVPISRGRAHPIRKRSAHIVVEVASMTGVAPVKAEKTSTPKSKAEVKTTENKATEKKPKSPAKKDTTTTAKKKTVKKDTLDKK